MLEHGTRLGAYEIIGAIGAGGMGEVYRALDTRLGRTVAVKVLKNHSERFEIEARSIAALNHPHICTLYDVGPGYMVMEYLEGQPIRGPLAPERVIELALQIASALEEAHDKGIVHRDLKPDNILLTASGVKVLDFGLAKQFNLDPDATSTRTGFIVGTLAYMSPEQAQGLPVDRRTDIFSFGLVLYETLTGHRATPGESLREAAPHIPESLARVVARCVHREPADRFQSMAEVARALRASLGDGHAEPSVAVLPFTNLSADIENEYFSDGLAEEIINSLTRIPGLKVTARTSAFAFKGRSEDVRQISLALGVAHVLEGSVRKAGNRVRIMAQLVSASDGLQVWADRYDREMNDIFAIQDEISERVVAALEMKLVGSRAPRAARRHNASVDAYQAYLEAQHHGNKRTAAGFALARQAFERAIQIDPEYALPHAGLAEMYCQLALFAVKPRLILPQALAEAEKALTLDVECAEAYEARGFIRGAFEYNWAAAGDDFARSLEINPSRGVGHFRRSNWSLVQTRRFTEAHEEMQRAVALDPLSPVVRIGDVVLNSLIGHQERALRGARTNLQLFPSIWVNCWLAAITLNASGFVDEALAAVERTLAADPGNPFLLATQALMLGERGEAAGARALIDKVEQAAAARYVSPYVLALAYSGVQDIDRVFRYLEQSVDECDPWPFVLFGDLKLTRLWGSDEFRSDPRRAALLGRMNLR